MALLRVFIVEERNLRQTWFGLRKPRLRNLLNAQEWQLSCDKESNHSIVEAFSASKRKYCRGQARAK